MSIKNIAIHDVFHTASLITRQTAQEIARVVSEAKETNITLSFANIEFATRSFFDQLYFEIQTLQQQEKHIELVNLSSSIKPLYEVVANNARKEPVMHEQAIHQMEAVKVVTL